jgi:Family of unknown function (DUF5343)
MAKDGKQTNGEVAAAASPAAYLPFRTFVSSIEALEHGIPKKIDRTIWRNQSGVVQSQILSAFRFFDLVDDEDRPTQALHSLVENKEQRKAVMGELVHNAYAKVIEMDLTKTTPKMLEDAFDSYGVVGDTKRKAVTFFLKAAKFADIPMHPLLAAQVRNTGPRRKRGERKGAPSNGTVKVTPTSTESGITSANTRTLHLRSGGTVAMTISYDPFSLSSDDRQFVFELIDKLQGYSEAIADEDDDADEDE